jgi:hypothetical protein
LPQFPLQDLHAGSGSRACVRSSTPIAEGNWMSAERAILIPRRAFPQHTESLQCEWQQALQRPLKVTILGRQNFYAIFILKTISFQLERSLVIGGYFSRGNVRDRDGFFSKVLRKISCLRGFHPGENFYINCGNLLLNELLAKWQLRGRYPPAQLTAQRISTH